METNKVLVILRGVPGCGKSTVAEFLIRKGGVCFAADDYFTDPNTGEYNFDPKELGNAHRLCRDNVMSSMVAEEPLIVIHNTNTTEAEIEPYYQMARDYGYMVFSMIVENRHNGKNSHNVPESVLQKMVNRFSIKLI